MGNINLIQHELVTKQLIPSFMIPKDKLMDISKLVKR